MRKAPWFLPILWAMLFSTASADDCTGDNLINAFTKLGFQQIEIINTMRTPRNLDREVMQGFREYRLDNYEILRKVPKADEIDQANRMQLIEEAFKDIRFAVILEFEEPEWALKGGIERVSIFGSYIDAIGNYLIISPNKTIDVKRVSSLLKTCKTPLYEVFRHAAKFSIPSQWQSYKKAQPSISEITQKRDWHKANKDSPLIAAIKNEDTQKIIELINSKDIDLNQKDKRQNRSPLHWLLFSDSVSMIDQLVTQFIDKGINCDTQDQYGVTPLMLAAQHSLNATQAVIRCGVDVSKMTDNGQTALSFAQNAGLGTVVELLQKKGL